MFFFLANEPWLLAISGSTLVMSASATAQNVLTVSTNHRFYETITISPRQFSKKEDIVLNVAQRLLCF